MSNSDFTLNGMSTTPPFVCLRSLPRSLQVFCSAGDSHREFDDSTSEHLHFKCGFGQRSSVCLNVVNDSAAQSVEEPVAARTRFYYQ